MINIKSADLTNPQQKVVAFILLVIVGSILWVVTPPLLLLFKNVTILLIYVVLYVFVILNIQNIWNGMKQLSWELTKKIISTNPVWHLDRGYDYVVNQMNKLSTHIGKIAAIKLTTEKEVQKLIRENKELELAASKTSGNQVKIYASKIGSNQNLIEKLLPRIDVAGKQQMQMQNLLDVWRVDTELMRHDIDSLSKEYELMKELDSATNAANAFMQTNTPEMKRFKQAMKETERKISMFTTNVESFQRDVIPTLSLANGRADMLQEEGLALIEEYKNKRLNK
jgi:hypothetical protein